MSYMSLRLQRDVERKLIQMDLDLRNIDVLVIDGGVVLTGKFIHRTSSLNILNMILFTTPRYA